jgi:hypothetical protein
VVQRMLDNPIINKEALKLLLDRGFDTNLLPERQKDILKEYV